MKKQFVIAILFSFCLIVSNVVQSNCALKAELPLITIRSSGDLNNKNFTVNMSGTIDCTLTVTPSSLTNVTTAIGYSNNASVIITGSNSTYDKVSSSPYQCIINFSLSAVLDYNISYFFEVDWGYDFPVGSDTVGLTTAVIVPISSTLFENVNNVYIDNITYVNKTIEVPPEWAILWEEIWPYITSVIIAAVVGVLTWIARRFDELKAKTKGFWQRYAK